jgi:tetratricopeptide (TPR) repeat protein
MQHRWKQTLGNLKPLCVLVLIVSAGCPSMWRSWYLDSNAKNIAKAAKAIETARDDGERARAYSERGRGYSERARYSKAFHLIAADEYSRLFDLAIKDHDRAVSLAPSSSDAYLYRALTYYDRAALEELTGPEAKAHFASAEADFTMAIARDGHNARAFDMRGLIYTVRGDHDHAIADFTQVMTIDAHLGKLRLAEAYCERGFVNQRASNYDAAISDYEKAMEFHTGGGGCECQPESPLAWIYYETKQYDKSWDVVRRAKQSRRWIAPEVIDQLKAVPRSANTTS